MVALLHFFHFCFQIIVRPQNAEVLIYEFTNIVYLHFLTFMGNKTWLVALSLLALSQPGKIFAEHTNAVNAAVALQQAKEKVVTGEVSDDTGPVIGASVRVQGTTNGTITDIDGKFSLKVRIGQVLEVSFIGYEDKKIVYKGEQNLKVRLSENVTQLQEVQVIAYGTTKKVTVTGALSSVKSDEIMKSPVASVANALSGKIPGLSSVQSSGQPGADNAALYVRGVGSLSTSLSSPLCLVDGVERSFNQIDPNEIEDITVLKDASATAVFGVRGANGVILVTTKRGEKGKAKVSFSTSASVQTPTNIPEFANSYDYVKTYREAQLRDGVAEDKLTFTAEDLEGFRTQSDPLLYPSISWTDLLIDKSAWQTQHNLSISGGSDRARYFASLSAFTQDGLFHTFKNGHDKGFNYKRYNYRINMDINVTKTTLFKINLGGLLSTQTQPNYNNGVYTSLSYLYNNIYSAVPFSGAGLVDGKWIGSSKSIWGKFGELNDGLGSYYGKGYNTNTGNTVNFDFQLEQKLNFITKGLKFHAKGAYNSTVSYNKRREGRLDRYEAILVDGETVLKKTQEASTLGYSSSASKSRDWYLEGALNYQRDFGKHHVSGLAMYNQTMKYYYSSSGNYAGIARAYVGLVGRATYDYATRYLLDLSIGYNGSENFAEGKRFGIFPAGSIGWIVSEEKFMQPLKPYLSYLKLRASYGIVGNDQSDSRFLYLPDSYTLSTGSSNFGATANNALAGSKESKKGNPDVTWETSAKQNYGIDIHFFDSRLKMTFDYFIEHRKDILITRQINPGYLAITLPTVNMGKVDNKGYEITARWEDKIKNVRYYIGSSVSYAKNKVIFKDEIPSPYEWMCSTGRPVGQQFGYVTDGYFSVEDAANYAELKGKEGGIPNHGEGFSPKAGDVKYKDLNGDGKIDANDRSAIGYPTYPLLTGNVQAGISWKGLDFSMTWSGAFKTSRMVSSIYRYPFGTTGQSSLMKYMIEDAWTPEKGNSAKAPAISLSGSTTNNYQDSDLWLRDASYVRLKNIELGYSFPKSIVSKLKIGSLRLSVSGYNLLTFSDLDFCDPESNAEGNAYPLIKIVNFGLKVGF